jgi:adenylosuccinate synthase
MSQIHPSVLASAAKSAKAAPDPRWSFLGPVQQDSIMANVTVIGSQWGDEGKGKIVDWLASRADAVVRFQGGHNAGHTLVVGEQVYKLSLLPSGIVTGTLSIIGNGVVLDPWALRDEITKLRGQGVVINAENFAIADNCALILPFHRDLDALRETAAGAGKIGTTGRGIGPAYVDKMARTGLRVSDLFDREEFEGRLGHTLKYKNLILREIFKDKGFEADAICDEYFAYGQAIKQYVGDTSLIIHNALREEKIILFEGAQGTLLDVTHGTYPYVTSSHPVAGGACVGAGIGPTKIDRVLGITKAYTTRVGEGPFPTELQDEIGDHIQKKGGEFGTTTGRPRRCGWLDALLLRYSVRINGMSALAMTKLDVLDELDTIKICVGYKVGSETITEFTTDFRKLRECSPVYEEMPGWKEDTSGVKDYRDLPQGAKEYIKNIERIIKAPISIISVGPRRAQTVILRKFV